MTVTDASVAEGNFGFKEFTVPVTLTPGHGEVTVNWATTAGTAANGTDFTPRSGSLTFAPSENSKLITLQVIGDAIDENDETFVVNLSSPSGAQLAKSQSTITITDEDNPPTVSNGNTSVTEGSGGTTPATFNLSLSGVSGKQVQVAWQNQGVTAFPGSDYALADGVVTIPAGQLSGSVSVQVTGDTLDEENEVFAVQLSAPVNVTISDGEGLERSSTTTLEPPPAQHASCVVRRNSNR